MGQFNKLSSDNQENSSSETKPNQQLYEALVTRAERNQNNDNFFRRTIAPKAILKKIANSPVSEYKPYFIKGKGEHFLNGETNRFEIRNPDGIFPAGIFYSPSYSCYALIYFQEDDSIYEVHFSEPTWEDDQAQQLNTNKLDEFIDLINLIDKKTLSPGYYVFDIFKKGMQKSANIALFSVIPLQIASDCSTACKVITSPITLISTIAFLGIFGGIAVVGCALTTALSLSLLLLDLLLIRPLDALLKANTPHIANTQNIIDEHLDTLHKNSTEEDRKLVAYGIKKWEINPDFGCYAEEPKASTGLTM